MELVSNCVFYMNVYPGKSGVSNTMSPRIIITGLTINYNKNYKLQFGEYVQNHDSHYNITGTTRTIEALSFFPNRK